MKNLVFEILVLTYSKIGGEQNFEGNGKGNSSSEGPTDLLLVLCRIQRNYRNIGDYGNKVSIRGLMGTLYI